MEFIMKLIPALTAFIAVIVGPFVTILIAKRQIRANVVSTSRHKWIGELQGIISDFVAELRVLSVGFGQGELRFHSENKAIEAARKCYFIETKINLMLNPHEAEHQEFSRLTRSAVALIGDKESSQNAMVESTNKVVNFAQSMLKTEWEKVKRGE